MSIEDAKRELFRHFARVAKAMSSPARLELLDLLSQAEKPVETLARQAGLSVTNTSNHLRELRATGLVANRREGLQVYYRLADPAVHEFLRCLQEIARRQLAEVREIVREYFDGPESLEPVHMDALLERMKADEVVVLDVRPEDEYAAGHVPGALSVQVKELERMLEELPPGKEVVAYCRGPYCVLSVKAVEILRSRGIRARRLDEGLPDWRDRGLAVTAGSES